MTQNTVKSPSRSPSQESATPTGDEKERKVFMEDLTIFLQSIGKPLLKTPAMGYKDLDLYQFYKEVQVFGGYHRVTKKVGTWSKIWKRLSNYDASITDSSSRLKRNYQRFLLDFEYKMYPQRRVEQKNIKTNSSKRPKASPSKVKDVPRDALGKPIFPIQLGEITIHHLGEIIPSRPYYDDKHIYPIGFTSSRMFSSMLTPNKRVQYFSKVIDVQNRPRFMVTAMDSPDSPIIADTPTEAWKQVLQRISAVETGEFRKSVAVSGALRFGLLHPTTIKLVSELPYAELCHPIKKRKERSSSEDESGSSSSSSGNCSGNEKKNEQPETKKAKDFETIINDEIQFERAVQGLQALRYAPLVMQ